MLLVPLLRFASCVVCWCVRCVMFVFIVGLLLFVVVLFVVVLVFLIKRPPMPQVFVRILLRINRASFGQ